jgi:hypothetical protein
MRNWKLKILKQGDIKFEFFFANKQWHRLQIPTFGFPSITNLIE